MLFTSAPGAAEWLAAARREGVLDDDHHARRDPAACSWPRWVRSRPGPLERLGLHAAARRARAPRLARPRRRDALRRRQRAIAPTPSPAGSRCAAAGAVLDGAPHPAVTNAASTCSRRCSMPRAASSRGRVCSARCPAPARTRTRSRWPSRACARRSAPRTSSRRSSSAGYRLNVIDPADAAASRR